MKKSLIFVSEMSAGGAETVMMKYYRALNKDKYQLDFCVTSTSKAFHDDEIESLGGKKYIVPKKSKHPVASFRAIRSLIKNTNYDSVVRMGAHSLAALDLIACKQGGVKHTVFRSTNSKPSNGLSLKLVSHYLFRPILNKVTEIKLAPSEMAADYMFGKDCIRKDIAHILPNAINPEDYSYSVIDRENFRRNLNISPQTVVIGTVGRLTPQKNQKFLIEVLSKMDFSQQDFFLLIVGKGTCYQALKDHIAESCLEDRVAVLPPTPDVRSVYSAMDLFVLPSFFEGLPNVLIEAQASGLPCVVSSRVTQEAKILDSTLYLDLDKGSQYWAKRLTEMQLAANRETCYLNVYNTQFSINKAISLFEKYVFDDAYQRQK